MMVRKILIYRYDSFIAHTLDINVLSVPCTTNVALVIGLERENYVVDETIRRVVNASDSGNTTSKNTTVVQQTSVRVCAVVFDGTVESGTNVLVRMNTQSGTATGSG